MALIGRTLTDDHKKKIGNSHRGKEKSEAHKEKMRKYGRNKAVENGSVPDRETFDKAMAEIRSAPRGPSGLRMRRGERQRIMAKYGLSLDIIATMIDGTHWMLEDE